MPGYIHHIEWCVSDLDGLSDQLINQFGFREISGRKTRTDSGPDSFLVRQKVLKSGLTVFLLTEKSGGPSGKNQPVGLKSQKNLAIKFIRDLNRFVVCQFRNRTELFVWIRSLTSLGWIGLKQEAFLYCEEFDQYEEWIRILHHLGCFQYFIDPKRCSSVAFFKTWLEHQTIFFRHRNENFFSTDDATVQVSATPPNFKARKLWEKTFNT